MYWYLREITAILVISLFLTARITFGTFIPGMQPIGSQAFPGQASIKIAFSSLQLMGSKGSLIANVFLFNSCSLHNFKVLWKCLWKELPFKPNVSVNRVSSKLHLLSHIVNSWPSLTAMSSTCGKSVNSSGLSSYSCSEWALLLSLHSTLAAAIESFWRSEAALAAPQLSQITFPLVLAFTQLQDTKFKSIRGIIGNLLAHVGIFGLTEHWEAVN